MRIAAMGVIIRQSLKSSVASYAGVVVGAANTIFLMPAILSVTELGLVRAIIDGAFMLSTYGKFGIPNTAIKFFPYFKEKEKLNGLMGMLLFFLSLGFLIIFLLTQLFHDALLGSFVDKSPEFIAYFNHVLLLGFIYTLFFGLQTYSSLFLRIAIPKFIGEVLLRVGVSVALALHYYEYLSFDQMIDFFIVTYTICLLLMVLYIQYLGKLYLVFTFSGFDKGLLKEMAVYSSFMVVAGGGAIIVSKIDVLMLAAMMGTGFTGIYGTAFFMATLVEMPKRSLTSISAPILARHFKENNLAEIKVIYQKSSTNLLLAGGIVTLMVWLNVDDIFRLMPQSEIFATGKLVVLFIALSKLFDMSMGINTELIGNSPFYRWNVFIMPLFAVAIVVSNLIFIPIYGIEGAAIASLLSVMAYNLVRFVLVWFKMKIQPFSMGTLRSLLVLSATFASGSFLIVSTDKAFVDILIRSTQMATVFGLFTLWLQPSEDIHQLAIQLRKKVLGR